MPFLGRDWRSPGEAWVKTPKGWERKKILERLNNNTQDRYSRGNDLVNNCESSDSDNDNEISLTQHQRNMLNDHVMQQWQPYCQITLKNTKEVAGYNMISEAFQRLDFRNAVRDIRRFNYICKLLHLLITQNLTTLSGCATKVLFTMLEEVACQVASNQQNLHILHTLLNDLKRTMRKYYCWGRPLGSTLLWEQHLQTIERICHLANCIQIKEPDDDGTRRLTDMPVGVLRDILLRLSDYKDLINSGEAYDVMKTLVDEQHIWRELCKFHFTRQQIRIMLDSSKTKSMKSKTDWQLMFHQLRRKFGLREEYADSLFLCRHCRCLFWKSFGHPCVDFGYGISSGVEYNRNEENKENENIVSTVPVYIPIPPQAFLSFFSL